MPGEVWMSGVLTFCLLLALRGPVSLTPGAYSPRVCQKPPDPDGGQKTIQEKCRCLWVCFEPGAAEGRGRAGLQTRNAF